MRAMTGYSSVSKTNKFWDVQIIIRAVNFKYLDVTVHNLRPEEVILEEKIKREIKNRVSRGKIEVFVYITTAKSKKFYINEKVVAEYITQARSLSKKYKLNPEINVKDILNLPQTFSFEKEKKGIQPFVFILLKEALNKFIEFKEKEGLIIKKEILLNLDKLNFNVENITKQKPKAKSMENGKEDIDEELSLMSFYISKLENKINSKKRETKGKSMDFLTQEILRELNAASSKTKIKTAALLIVEGKNYLERIREQVQNIE